jgi:hypothetical protein
MDGDFGFSILDFGSRAIPRFALPLITKEGTCGWLAFNRKSEI